MCSSDLSVRDVAKKGGILVGFHEKRSSFVADMQSCEVIPKRISALLVPLRRLIESLSLRQRLPQIELAIGDGVDALVLRILEPLTPADETLLREFADRHAVRFFLQTKGPETAVPFYPPGEPLLYYRLPEFDLRLGFLPTEFTQVNHAVNTVLVRRAMALLGPQPGERIADLFCGLGNFSLAIARRDDYAKVGIPMMPVTYGVEFTRLHVLLYTVIMVIVTLLPYLTGLSGLLYLAATLGLNAVFLYYALALKLSARADLPMKLFRFSIQYLMWLFLALLVDHYLPYGPLVSH